MSATSHVWSCRLAEGPIRGYNSQMLRLEDNLVDNEAAPLHLIAGRRIVRTNGCKFCNGVRKVCCSPHGAT